MKPIYVVAPLLAIGAALVIPQAANAAPSNSARMPGKWMTKTEYRSIQRGDSVATVRAKVGNSGRLFSSHTYTDGGYCEEWNADYSACSVFLPERQHSDETYEWRTGRFSKHGGSVRFVDGAVASKSFHRVG